MAEKMKIENGSRSNHIIISGRDGGKTFTWLTTHFCDPGPRFQIVWSGVNTMEVAFDRDEDATMCRLMAQC